MPWLQASSVLFPSSHATFEFAYIQGLFSLAPPKRFKKVEKWFCKEGLWVLVIVFRIYIQSNVFARKGGREENKGQ